MPHSVEAARDVALTEAGIRALAPLAKYFLGLGTTGFGGPVALVGYMQRDLVERRRWFTETEFTEGLALAQLAPGPLAAQLAMYLGWLRGGAVGATMIAVAFVAPPFLMVLVLAVLYAQAGELEWMRQAFVGVGAGVVCILARSTLRLARLTLRADRWLWGIAMVNMAVVVLEQRELVLLLLASGLLVLLTKPATLSVRLPAVIPGWWITTIQLSSTDSRLAELFVFFLKAGAAVFGSGLAIIPFLYTGLVEHRHWLTERQFVDAIAVSLITPGPVVITATFIGYLIGGWIGGIVAALGVFLPALVIVLIVAPRLAAIVKHPGVRLFVDGVTAAATGAIAAASVLLAVRVITDGRALIIGLVVLIALVARIKVPEAALVVAAGLLGILLT